MNLTTQPIPQKRPITKVDALLTSHATLYIARLEIENMVQATTKEQIEEKVLKIQAYTGALVAVQKVARDLGLHLGVQFGTIIF